MKRKQFVLDLTKKALFDYLASTTGNSSQVTPPREMVLEVLFSHDVSNI